MAAELASQKTPAAWLGEISHCSARANAKKTHVILDLRPALFGSLAKHADTIIKLLESYEGERLGRKPPGSRSPFRQQRHCLTAPALLSARAVGRGLFLSSQRLRHCQTRASAAALPNGFHSCVATAADKSAYPGSGELLIVAWVIETAAFSLPASAFTSSRFMQ